MFSRRSPLPVLRQIFLRVVDSYRAVRYGGDHLPQRLGAHVARGEHAGEVGASGFIRDTEREALRSITKYPLKREPLPSEFIAILAAYIKNGDAA